MFSLISGPLPRKTIVTLFCFSRNYSHASHIVWIFLLDSACQLLMRADYLFLHLSRFLFFILLEEFLQKGCLRNKLSEPLLSENSLFLLHTVWVKNSRFHRKICMFSCLCVKGDSRNFNKPSHPQHSWFLHLPTLSSEPPWGSSGSAGSHLCYSSLAYVFRLWISLLWNIHPCSHMPLSIP